MEKEENLVKSEDFIYGSRAVIEAVLSGRSIDKVLIRNGLSNELSAELYQLIRERQVPFQFVPLEKINRITRRNHQGVVALMAPVDFIRIEEVLPLVFERGEDPFLLVLDQVTDVRNFGAVMRTAVCAGVHAVVIPEKGSARIGEDAMKTSAGALNHLLLCRTGSLSSALEYIRDSGLRIVAATEKSSLVYTSADMRGPLALILGSEEKGISRSLLGKADCLVKIPLSGKIESLNVSAAAAVVMYEVVRQRGTAQE